MLGVRRMLEMFLQVHECARRLDQALEKIIVGRVPVKPEMLQNIVRFVVTLVVPTSKVSAIERMVGDVAGEVGVVAFEVPHELRNPFAFVHEAFNFTMPHMMGKPTFLEGTEILRCHTQE